MQDHVRDSAPTSDAPHASSLSRIYELLRFVVVAAFIALAVWTVKEALTVVFASVLLAVILHGTAAALSRLTRLPYWLALGLVVLLLLGALAALGARAGPELADQATELRNALQTQAMALQKRLSETSWGQLLLQQIPDSLSLKGDSAASNMPSGLASSLAGYLGTAFGLLGTFAVIMIAGLYLAATPAIYVNGTLRLFPVRHRERAKTLIAVGARALWAWSAGQALDMLVVGLLSGFGLWMIGVPLALVLGVVAGLLNFVPYIGAILGAVPAIILAFSVGSAAGLETIALYVAIQAFEGNVMAPMIQNRAVHMPPGLTILSQTVFGAILGIPGLIFATPLTAAILAICNEATPPLVSEHRLE